MSTVAGRGLGALAVGLVLCLAAGLPGAQSASSHRDLRPDERSQWDEAGVSLQDVPDWKHVGLGPTEAGQWVRAGIGFAGWARQWKDEGFGPADAARWAREANPYTAAEFRGRGFSPAAAIAWIGHGVGSALRAEQFRRLGLSPEEGGRWWARGFTPDEILPWSRGGFGPEAAREWKWGENEDLDDGVSFARSVFTVAWAQPWRAAGFSAEEARQAAAIGLGLTEAVAWRGAGFGVREAVHWTDSGFRPAEATGWRALGLGPVEAEQRRDASGAGADDEIVSLHADIHLRADASILVTERFEVLNGPGGPIQDCLPRDLPARTRLRYRQRSSRDARPTYRRIVAAVDQVPAGIESRRARGDRLLCVRPAGAGLPEGPHVVTLAYVTEGRLITRRDRPELFFDVLGPGVPVSVGRASATVHLPAGADVVFADGYAGLPERKDFTVRVGRHDGADVVDYAVWRPLRRDMRFRVSVGFTRGFVAPGPWTRVRQPDHRTGGWSPACCSSPSALPPGWRPMPSPGAGWGRIPSQVCSFPGSTRRLAPARR